MASACINNIGLSPEKNFLECSATYSSFGWLSARHSFGREIPEEEVSKTTGLKKVPLPANNFADTLEESDPDVLANDFVDFEFRLEDPVTMLPADELFSDGKLIPLQLSMIRPGGVSTTTSFGVSSPDTPQARRKTDVSDTDPYLFSPKAPRCSSRWKELLGLRKLYQSSKQENHKTTSSHNSRSLKHFLHRCSKSSNDSSLNFPLLKDTTDTESISVSSRLSLSSSSSGHDHDDLPRLSLNSEKPGKAVVKANPNTNPPRVRLVKTRAILTDNSNTVGGNSRVGRSPIHRSVESTTTTVGGVSVDSPRMNSSGKIVFHSLERSSSSPSSFNGGPRFKHRGMERSYSANVRITSVLNVPVCSLRGSSKSGGVFGFPLFSSPQSKSQQNNGKSRTDRS